MNKLFLLILFLLLGFPKAGVQATTLNGRVYSGASGLPLGGAVVRSGIYNVKTDFKGDFNLKISGDEPIQILHPRFHTQLIKQSDLPPNGDFKAYLTPSAWAASEIQESTGVEWVDKPVYGSIADYTFLDDTLLIFSIIKSSIGGLNAKSTTEFCEIRLIQLGLSVGRYPFREPIFDMQHAADGRIYLTGDSLAWQFDPHNTTENLIALDFERYVEHVKYSIYRDSYTRFYLLPAPYLPQVVAVARDIKSGDGAAMRYMRSPSYFANIDGDYSMLSPFQRQEAADMALETGFAPQVFAPLLRSRQMDRDIRLPYVAGFAQTNTLYIFDHRNDWLFKHDLLGRPVDSMKVYHNRLPREELLEVIQDPSNEAMYTVHDKNGSIMVRCINTITGATGKPLKLHYPFGYRVKIFEGYVYYLHQPIEKGSYVQLLREPLPKSIKN